MAPYHRTAGQPNVVIVMARCARSGQPFGLRFEEVAAGKWSADWAFAVAESVARREGYHRTDMRGAFGVAPEYPGCPHCHGEAMLQCGCGRVVCWDGQTQRLTCPWCHCEAQLGGGTVDRLTAGLDR